MIGRDDAEIWEDYANNADILVRELKYAMTLAKAVARKVRESGDIDTPLFRDLERKIYKAYGTAGDMSELLDEVEQ